MATVRSADGTLIAYDRVGSGPAVALVHGAMTDKSHSMLASVATALQRWFTVFNYDRRGRGESGDTQPYAVAREIDDLNAVVAVAGGSAMVFGGSSGAALVLAAAAQNRAISKVIVWEPPYHVDAGAPDIPADFAERLRALVAADRRGDAVAMFMTEAAEMPADTVAAMRADPFWSDAEAIAHTLVYEAAVLGPKNALPTGVLSAIAQPTLVLTGGDSPPWMANTGKAVAAAIPEAAHRILDGQTHNVAAEALTPELLEFFTS